MNVRKQDIFMEINYANGLISNEYLYEQHYMIRSAVQV